MDCLCYIELGAGTGDSEMNKIVLVLQELRPDGWWEWEGQCSVMVAVRSH